MVKNVYRNLRSSLTFCPYVYQIKTAHSWKSKKVGITIAMKIRPFVSYSKWPGELDSAGWVYIACSLLWVRLSLWRYFSQYSMPYTSHGMCTFAFWLEYVVLLIVILWSSSFSSTLPPQISILWASATSSTTWSSQQKSQCFELLADRSSNTLRKYCLD